MAKRSSGCGGLLVTVVVVGALAAMVFERGDSVPPNGSGSGVRKRPKDVFRVPSDFQPSYTWIPSQDDDVSTGRARRLVRKIFVPTGLSRSVLARNVRHALRATYERDAPDAVTIYAYREGDGASGHFTAAMGTLAPEGKWSRARSGTPMSRFDIAIEFQDVYFAPPLELLAAGTTVWMRGDDRIRLSRSQESWDGKDVIATVPEGTQATVLEATKFAMLKEELAVYRVRTEAGIAGWVLGTYVQTSKEAPQYESIAKSSAITCDTFDLVVSLRGHNLTLSIDTDLPDSTTVMVSVGRVYRIEDSIDDYSESYFSTKTTVAASRQPRTVDVSDSVWRAALQKRAELMRALDEPWSVKSISKDITIRAVVPVNQSDSRFGRRNEHLGGTRVKESRGLRIVEAEKRIALPLRD